MECNDDVFCVMLWRPPISKRTDTLLPYTTRYRSVQMTRVFCQQGTSLRTAALVPYRVIGHRRSLERPLQIGTGFGIFAARCQKIGIEEVAVETGRIDRQCRLKIVARLVGAAKAERKSRHLAIQHAKADRKSVV